MTRSSNGVVAQKAIDRSSPLAMRDTGDRIAFRGVDQGTMRQHYDCSATCSCGARFDDRSLAGLRNQLALHVIACSGVI